MNSLIFGGAAAEQVNLTIEASNIDIDGDLIGFDGIEYIVDVPNVGEMRVSAIGAACSGPGCPEITFEPGGEATLSSEDRGTVMTGILVDFADGFYSLSVAGNVVNVPAASAICEGAGCPTIEFIVPASEVEPEQEPEPIRRTADLVMVGSDNVGEDLMPLVMDQFGETIGAALTDTVELPDDIVQYVFARDGGIYVVEVESTSSGPGLERLIEGTTDIAMSSRQAEPDEVAAIAAQGRGNLLDVSQEYIVGVDSVLMTVHPSNPVTELSRQQLAGIYRDRIVNWNQVGGPNASIIPVARDGGSARENFEKWAFGREGDLSSRTIEVDRGRDMRDFIEANLGSIGYSISDNIGDTKAIDLILDCGVRTAASPFKSKAEEYLLGRRIRLYIANDNPKPEVQQLVDMMIDPAVDARVDESGYFSLGLAVDDRALERLIEAAAIGQPQAIVQSVRADMQQALRGATRLSQTFRFATARSQFDSKALRDLDRLVDYMNRAENAGRELIFVGFADSRGDYNYNVGLSEQRANEVLRRVRNHPEAAELLSLPMSTIGFGESAPVGCNDNARGLSSNRRVEVWIR